jgi:hypothetical protein
MVLRSEYLVAQSESKANKDDAAAKGQDLIWLEEQLAKTQRQLSDSRQEAAQLRVEMCGMVQRCSLESLQQQLHEMETAALLESKSQREVIKDLNSRLSACDSERAGQINKMQVCAYKLPSIHKIANLVTAYLYAITEYCHAGHGG